MGTEGYSPSRQSISLGSCGELLECPKCWAPPLRPGVAVAGIAAVVGFGVTLDTAQAGHHTNNRGFFGIGGCSGFVIH